MRIRRLVQQVDEQHREAMRTIDADLAELHLGRREPSVDDSRRRFVRHLGLGGAVALGATAVPVVALAPSALAQTSGSSSSSAESLPAGDLTIIEFATGLELAANAAYGLAVDTRLLSSAQAEICRTFGRHHKEHADALAKLAGATDSSESSPNAAIVSALAPQIQSAGDANALFQVLYSIEEGAAATYNKAIGEFESEAAAGPAASIQPVEGQHAVVIGQLLDLPIDEWMPAFQTTTDAFDPAKYAG